MEMKPQIYVLKAVTVIEGTENRDWDVSYRKWWTYTSKRPADSIIFTSDIVSVLFVCVSLE